MVNCIQIPNHIYLLYMNLFIGYILEMYKSLLTLINCYFRFIRGKVCVNKEVNSILCIMAFGYKFVF